MDGENFVSSNKNPGEFLKQALGKAVVVKLNSGVDYRGVLACLDGFMNIAMEQTEEYVDGQLKSRYGDCFIRGNNGNLTFLFYSSMSRIRLFFHTSNVDSSLHKFNEGKEVKIECSGLYVNMDGSFGLVPKRLHTR